MGIRLLHFPFRILDLMSSLLVLGSMNELVPVNDYLLTS